MANKLISRLRGMKTVPSAIILGSAIGLFAVGSLWGILSGKPQQNLIWRQLLRSHDEAVLHLGADRLGEVYITDERMLRYKLNYSGKKLSAAAKTINAYADNASVPVYLLAVPTSAGIYGDTLPEAAPLINEHEMLQTLYSKLDDNVVRIEAESWLLAQRDQYIYYRTDPCWTGYGAYCVYRTAIRKLGFNAIGYDHFAVTHFSSDYFGRLAEEIEYHGITPDIVDLYHYDAEQPLVQITALRPGGNVQLISYFREDQAAETGSPADVYGSLTEPILHMETQNNNNRELLLLTDSFGGAMLPFLLQHYHTITAVNLELVQQEGLDWQSLTAQVQTETADSEEEEESAGYTQILILCGADTLQTSLLPDTYSEGSAAEK